MNHILQQLHFAAILSEVRCASLAVKLLNRDPVPFASEQAKYVSGSFGCVLQMKLGCAVLECLVLAVFTIVFAIEALLCHVLSSPA